MTDPVNVLKPPGGAMLPTVVPRTGYRVPAVAGNRPGGRIAGGGAAINDETANGGYARFHKEGSPAPKPGLCPKGMIVDVWA
jgi:hypothetical protein